MKFIIKKGSKVYDQLRELEKKIIAAKKAAQKLRKELGAEDLATNSDHIAGGIDALQFQKQPDGYRKVGQPWQRLYYPKADYLKKNKELAKKLRELPVVEAEELNDIVKFDGMQMLEGDGAALLTIVKCVGITCGKDYILMNTHEGAKYKPIPGIVEIKESEFQKMVSKIKA